MFKNTRKFASVAVTLAALATVGCGDKTADGRQALGQVGADSADVQTRADQSKLPLLAIAELDAGNAAYRAKMLDSAMVHYRAATTLAPDHVAPWYGVYMAANELKNTRLADSAMARVQALSSDKSLYQAHAEVSAASVEPPLPTGHPSTQPLPPGHPSTKPLPPGHPVPAKPPTP